MTINIKRNLEDYIESIDDIDQLKATELSYYPEFYILIKSIINNDIKIMSEEKKKRSSKPEERASKPDFTISIKNGNTIGYIEAKLPGDPLDDTTEQIQRYIKVFPNFILTDFYRFKLYINGNCVENTSLKDGCITNNDTYDVRFSKLFDRFLSKTTSVETEVKIIAELLAHITKDTLKPAIDERLKTEITQESGELYGAYTDFKENLLHNLTIDQFVDMYAQTITYGLLTAKMNHTDGTTFDRKNALFDIPKEFGVLHAVFKFIATDTLPDKIETALDEIVAILIQTNPGRVLKQYYDNDQGKDWFIHFYETFLGKYDAKEKKAKGVYYTPDAVVSYINRSVNDTLKIQFDKKLGFGNKDVRVLDPAAGTLSFITNACQIAIDEIKSDQGDGMIDGFIKNHILKRFYGFEVMMTPYVLGHLKMKSLLDKNNYPVKFERVRLFLTNTLDTRTTTQSTLSDIGRALSAEAVCVSKVRAKKPILAVIGNPPYSVNSANKGLFDTETELYKMGVKVNTDGLKKERRIGPLSDDYIKFIRFAHKQINDQGEGVIGFITNNSYLGGLIHRGMRKELMRSFDEIYILNLHGSVIHNEDVDKNVFDIKQGVSIVILVKTSKNTNGAKIYYSELFGTREYKYDYLNDNDINTTKWIELDVHKPYYFFEPKDFSKQNDYDRFMSISDIFKEKSIGVMTARDKLTIQNTDSEIWKIISDFCKLDIERAREKYAIGKDTANWSIKRAQLDIVDSGINRKKIIDILYRPFDIKSTYYTGKSSGFMMRPGKKIMQNMMHDNIGLLTSRKDNGSNIGHVYVCNQLSDAHTISDNTYISPLYLYTNNTKTPNITPSIISTLTTTYNTKPTPEDIFYYIYGILHSNIYRRKYAELLKIDFPKIPFTPDYDTFIRIGAIGKQLADLHLMKPKVFNHSTIMYNGVGDHKVEKITYDESTQRVSINNKQHFEGISKEVWEYQIGGYIVMQKWLKGRRHDILTMDDVNHYRYIGETLKKTIKLQVEIDKVYNDIDSGDIIDLNEESIINKYI